MCVVSAMGDYYGDKLRPWASPPTDFTKFVYEPDKVSKEEFDRLQAEFDGLKKQVEEMKEILKVAKLYDEVNGEPDCELEEKVKILKAVAELVGVDLDEIFG